MTNLPKPADFTAVLYDVSDHVATVTLNRPEVRNALDRRAYSELEAAFHHIGADPDIRCAIVTGADPAFCSGDDVRAIMLQASSEASTTRMQKAPATTPAAATILDCKKPVIAAVNGVAVGWGCELACYADFRIASEKARFGELFIKRGLVTDVAGIWRLPMIVGPTKASELIMTGDIIDATEALRIGLVSKVVPHEDLLAEAKRFAGRIAANPPLAVQALKEGLWKGYYGRHQEIGEWVTATLGRLFQTEDHKEGVASFLEKREPNYVGR